MSDWIGALIFIAIFVILPLLQKLAEQGKEAAERRRGKGAEPHEVSERARRMIYGEPEVREATPKGQGPSQDDEDEGDWIPLTPTPRRELQQRQPATPPPAPPLSAGQRQQPAEMVQAQPQQAPLPEPPHVIAERARVHEAQRRAHAEEQRRRQEAAQRKQEEQLRRERHEQQTRQRRRAQPTQATTPTARTRRGRLFEGAHEVRKAIVFAEILGPPKSLEDD